MYSVGLHSDWQQRHTTYNHSYLFTHIASGRTSAKQCYMAWLWSGRWSHTLHKNLDILLLRPVDWLKCCFTSTETVGLLGTGAQDGHLNFHTAPELCCVLWLWHVIYVCGSLWEGQRHPFWALYLICAPGNFCVTDLPQTDFNRATIS